MDKINKIIFFIESPYNQRDHGRFGIALLENNGFVVEVWEFTPFLHPEVHEQVKVSDPITYNKHFIFNSKREALNAILKIKDRTFIVFFMGYYFKAYGIFRAVSKKNLKYATFMANALPLPVSNQSHNKGIANILKRIKKITPNKLSNYMFPRVPFKLLGIKPATFNLAGGEESNHYAYPIDSNTKTLWLHSLDYDLYLDNKEKPNEIDNDVGVFLDEYLPFHPDYLHSGLPAASSPEEYYPLLCNFFDFIENKYHVKIIIAAHPRSRYEEYPDYFGGREVIRGQTIELVKKSTFVILHSSTSINFAILFKKPCIFITTEKIQLSYMGTFINNMSYLLGKTPILLDKNFVINWDEELKIDERAYKNYRNAYIKKDGTQELPFWQMFANELKQL